MDSAFSIYTASDCTIGSVQPDRNEIEYFGQLCKQFDDLYQLSCEKSRKDCMQLLKMHGQFDFVFLLLQRGHKSFYTALSDLENQWKLFQQRYVTKKEGAKTKEEIAIDTLALEKLAISPEVITKPSDSPFWKRIIGKHRSINKEVAPPLKSCLRKNPLSTAEQQSDSGVEQIKPKKGVNFEDRVDLYYYEVPFSSEQAAELPKKLKMQKKSLLNGVLTSEPLRVAGTKSLQPTQTRYLLSGDAEWEPNYAVLKPYAKKNIELASDWAALIEHSTLVLDLAADRNLIDNDPLILLGLHNEVGELLDRLKDRSFVSFRYIDVGTRTRYTSDRGFVDTAYHIEEELKARQKELDFSFGLICSEIDSFCGNQQ